MIVKRGVDSLRDVCHRDTLNKALEKYLQSCRDHATECDGVSETPRATRKKLHGRFPNIAGFCGFYGIGIEELDALSEEYPDQMSRLYAIFEDEALNSGLPPAVLSAYMKRRLGYDKDSYDGAEKLTTIRFEHDIYEDGE